MSKSLPEKAELGLDYPDFHYALLAEILSECVTVPPSVEARSGDIADETAKPVPADPVGVAEKLGLPPLDDDNGISQLTPEEEVQLLHVME
jgi:hypothetical protein